MGEVVKEKRSRERKVEGGRERRRSVLECGAGGVGGGWRDGSDVVVVGVLVVDIRNWVVVSVLTNFTMGECFHELS